MSAAFFSHKGRESNCVSPIATTTSYQLVTHYREVRHWGRLEGEGSQKVRNGNSAIVTFDLFLHACLALKVLKDVSSIPLLLKSCTVREKTRKEQWIACIERRAFFYYVAWYAWLISACLELKKRSQLKPYTNWYLEMQGRRHHPLCYGSGRSLCYWGALYGLKRAKKLEAKWLRTHINITSKHVLAVAHRQRPEEKKNRLFWCKSIYRLVWTCTFHVLPVFTHAHNSQFLRHFPSPVSVRNGKRI